jgi:hypothetical protein
VASRLSDQDQTDAQRLQSRRVLLAFRRGSNHGSFEKEPRPGRALLGGIALAALATLIAGVVGLLRGGPPNGWDRDGNIVVDDDSGTLYLVDSGALRPVANETSLRLAFPAGAPAPVRVDGDTIASRPHGATFGRTDLPARPPRLLAVDTPVLTCAEGDQPVIILGSTTPPGSEATALVSTGRALFLVTGRRTYQLGGYTTVDRLGYPRDKVERIPEEMLSFLDRGSPMIAVTLPKSRPLPPKTPQWQRTGSRVIDAGTGRTYVVVNRVLRPVLNETGLRLVYGPRIPRAPRLPSKAIRALRGGAPIGAEDHPDVPPRLTGVSGRRLCVSDRLSAVSALPISGLVSAPVSAGSGKAVLWTPPGAGMLLASSEEAKKAPSAENPVLLLAQGSAFPVESAAVLRSLGYSSDSVVVTSRSWLDRLPVADPVQQLTR